MRLFFIQILLISSTFSFSQELTDGMTFYLSQDLQYTDRVYESDIDRSYHTKFNDGKYQIFTKDSSLIFNEKFDYYPSYSGNSFFKGKSGEKNYVFSPKKKLIIEINPRLSPYISDLKVVTSTMLGDTLIWYKENHYLNLKGEIIFASDYYSESSTENKKQVLKTETDAFFEDKGYFDQMAVEDYDDGIKEQIILRDLKNNFLNHEEFDYVENTSDGVNFGSYNEKIEERYFVIRKNKKYGILSSLGKYVLPTKFDYIEFLDSEYDKIPDEFPFIKAYLGKTCYVFNIKGHGIFQNDYLSRDSYAYNQDDDLGIGSNFIGFEIEYKNKKGLLQQNGHLILPPIFDRYDFFQFKRTSEHFSLIDCPKDLTLKSSCSFYPYNEYFIGKLNKEKESHFYASNGQFLNKYKIDYLDDYTKNGFLLYDFNGKYGLIGPSACEILKPEFESIQLFKGAKNSFIVSTEEENYFIDDKGTKLFGESFSTAYFVDTIYAVVYAKSAYGLMDVYKSNTEIKWILKPEFETMEAIEKKNNEYRSSFTNYIVSVNGKFGIIDTNSNYLLPLEYSQILVMDKFIYTVKNKKHGLVKQNYLDDIVHELIPNSYDSLFNTGNNYGDFFVKKNEKWAFYNIHDKKEGTAFEFDGIDLIRNLRSHVVVSKKGKWGVLDSNYNWFVDAKYKKIYYDAVSKEFECLKENGEKDCFFKK
ncbi:MAG: hypothetical protein V4622_09925 [Bacteroidota bacterium]